MMQIPRFYHHPDDRTKPPDTECFELQGKAYCRFRAGNLYVSYPRSFDVLMEDGKVIAEGDLISGPYVTDAGLAIMIQTGTYTHIICAKTYVKIRARIEDLNIAELATMLSR